MPPRQPEEDTTKPLQALKTPQIQLVHKVLHHPPATAESFLPDHTLEDMEQPLQKDVLSTSKRFKPHQPKPMLRMNQRR